MMPEPRATTTSGPCAEVWAHAPSGAGAQSTILHSTRFWAGHMFRWFSFTCEKVLPFHWFLYSTHIRWVLVPGVVGAVTTGCSPFPLGPCDRFPGGLHAFRLEPPACRGLAYLQPAVPTVGRGSALSPLQTGRLSWSFLLEQKRMVRKRQGWPWQKETGKSSGSERPSFQPPLPAPCGHGSREVRGSGHPLWPPAHLGHSISLAFPKERVQEKAPALSHLQQREDLVKITLRMRLLLQSHYSPYKEQKAEQEAEEEKCRSHQFSSHDKQPGTCLLSPTALSPRRVIT